MDRILTPARTPPQIVAKVETTLLQIMQTPDTTQRFAALGADPSTSTPTERLADRERARQVERGDQGRARADRLTAHRRRGATATKSPQ
jgi:tripartite-type tricarboxylate transporter receptor subunit TctC